jgi:aspartyl-tRNA(Asn)/glutamyl-tRNA(Gln) amidotransferase subunit A
VHNTFAFMHSHELVFTPITELASRIASRELRSADLVDACIAQTERYQPRFNAFVANSFDRARELAERRDREARRGLVRGPLHGIPIAVKDVIDLEGLPTTAGSRIRQSSVASRTAPALQRVIDAGAIVLGKTNCDEFMRGGTSVHSVFGKTPNPWNVHHTPGGSSGGSAVAVASGMAVAAIGTDSGGSVVGPAAFCNLAGIRPTFGRVSRTGVVPLAPSFDTTGPMTRTVADAALFLQALAGPDPSDPATGVGDPPYFLEQIEQDLEGITIGVPDGYIWLDYEPETDALTRAAIEDLKSLGAKVVSVELPWAEACRSVFNAVMAAESAEYHRSNLRDRRDDYVSPGADFFEAGLFMQGWRYVQGQKARTWMIRQAAKIFRHVDAIVAPTTPIAPPSFETCMMGMPVQATISHCKRPFAPLGVPVLGVPAGFTPGGLPAGMQIVGRWGDEPRLFRIGAAYEARRPWWKQRPPLDDTPEPVPGFSDWARAAEEEVPGGSKSTISEQAVLALAAGIGHRVDPRRLRTLTSDINRELVRMQALDALPLAGFPRADELHLLTLDLAQDVE